MSAFAKFRKETISFVMSFNPHVRKFARTSVRMDEIGFQWTDFQ